MEEPPTSSQDGTTNITADGTTTAQPDRTTIAQPDGITVPGQSAEGGTAGTASGRGDFVSM